MKPEICNDRFVNEQGVLVYTIRYVHFANGFEKRFFFDWLFMPEYETWFVTQYGLGHGLGGRKFNIFGDQISSYPYNPLY